MSRLTPSNRLESEDARQRRLQSQLVVPLTWVLCLCADKDLDVLSDYLIESFQRQAVVAFWVRPYRDFGRMWHSSSRDFEVDGHAIHHEEGLRQSFGDLLALLLHCYELHERVVEVLDGHISVVEQSGGIDLVDVLEWQGSALDLPRT